MGRNGRLGSLVVLLVHGVLPGCMFDAALSEGATVTCRDGLDCPAALVCLTGTCVSPDSPCLSVEGRDATPERDGNDCGGGRVCVAGVCAQPRCGDGVVTAPEACDDGAANSDAVPDACRADCTQARCGDGVIDGLEVCDGDAACRDDCGKLEVCGDGERDTREACDDANDNPRDGCDACGAQQWVRGVFVRGAIEGVYAVDVSLYFPIATAVDALGRILVSDASNYRVRRVEPDGSITTIAGNGVAGFSGDGGPATAASFDSMTGVGADLLGRVWVADTGNARVRRVDPDGVVQTVAGTGVRGFSGDGGPASLARLDAPSALAVEPSGAVLVVDRPRVRRIAPDGTIRTVAGNGSASFSGDGGAAIDAGMAPVDVALDALGRLLIADDEGRRVRRVDVDGTIDTIAGNGAGGPSGEGGPALDAALAPPSAVAVAQNGDIFIGSNAPALVARVDAEGLIHRFAGDGAFASAGDGGSALAASFFAVSDLSVDAQGRLLITDLIANRVRRVGQDGVIETVVGDGGFRYVGDDGLATSASLVGPAGLTTDAQGRLLISDTLNGRIRRVERDGVVRRVLGRGTLIVSAIDPDDFSALSFPEGATAAANGDLLVVDSYNHRVLRMTPDGAVSRIAGRGVAAFDGDGDDARDAALNNPTDVVEDSLGRVVIADWLNARVRRVELDGTIVTVAGSGELAFSGDGAAAIDAGVDPVRIDIDANDAILIADRLNHRVRRVGADGIITTVAGDGAPGYSGDGGDALAASLNEPSGVAVAPDGSVVIADRSNHVVRVVDAGGVIRTVAGSGAPGLSGEGGSALLAQLDTPGDVAVDERGRVLVLDTNNGRVRRVEEDGTLVTVVGALDPPGPGPFSRAQLYASRSLVHVDGLGLFSAGALGRVMHLDLEAELVSVIAGAGAEVAPSARQRARFAPLFADAAGVAVDASGLTLFVTERGAPGLRTLTLGGDTVLPPAQWQAAAYAIDSAAPAGVVFDARTETLVVADEADHCVRRHAQNGAALEVLAGVCGAPGAFPGFLSSPTHVALSPVSGALYIADTGNHRVVRVSDAAVEVVLGDGSISSAGEGTPARSFPVRAPGQLVLDAFGNLYVAATTAVRMVANVDGDADADGDDAVRSIYGAGERTAFPESVSLCLSSLSLVRDTLYVADACQGFVIALSSQTTPLVAP